jgi:hypothetical protein
MELNSDFEKRTKNQETNLDNQEKSTMNKTKEEPTWKFMLRKTLGVIFIFLGVISILGIFATYKVDPANANFFDPHGLLVLYLFLFGGARLLKNPKEGEISLMKRFWVNFAAFWVICIPVAFLEELIFGTYTFWYSYITFIIVVESGIIKRIIIRRQKEKGNDNQETIKSPLNSVENSELPHIPKEDEIRSE